MIFLLLKHNDEKHKKLTSTQALWHFLGGVWGKGGCAFPYVKIVGKFGRETNETLWSA